MDTFISIISSLGFPIAMCLAMGWYVKYITDNNRNDINNLNEQHKQEMTEVTTALNNNTLALQQLCDKLGSE